MIKSSLTLKTVAGKAGWTPGEVLSETYGVSRFAIANPIEARLLDADGRADAVTVPLDRGGAALEPATADAQAGGAKWSGGVVRLGAPFLGRCPHLRLGRQYAAGTQSTR